ncbi:MAG: NAD(P)-dependent alcohol dehydrogenase [Holophaga sp.]|nr:NAD(P)-dependent alcohol dehydrogenase [Holophaga sp.]
MKAILQSAYGDPALVLSLGEAPMPRPATAEVVVRVRAASVHADVWHMVKGWPAVLRIMGGGFARPKTPIPGTDMAGVVESVGNGVTRFQIGDAVFGECVQGFQWANGGAFAEYVAVSADVLALKPDNVTFEQAACVPTAGLIAWHNLMGHRPWRSGQHVLINGAGGGVGAIALQLAKSHGAEVTAVEHSDKLALVRALGADHVLDYTRDDPTQGSARYDLILDVASNLSVTDCARVLQPDGVYILIGHDHYGALGFTWLGSGIPAFLKLAVRTAFNPHLIKPNMAAPDKAKGMALFADLMAKGQLKPVVDRTYPLAEAAHALAYLASGRALGRIILSP